LGSPPRWNGDPKTGVEAPLSFGKLLDYRNPRRVGTSSICGSSTGISYCDAGAGLCPERRRAVFGVIRRHLESWFDDCPTGWAQLVERARAGIRLINWSVAWQSLEAPFAPVQDDEGARFRRRWLDAVFQHAHFVQGHFSLYSSANNHLIARRQGCLSRR